MNGKLLVALLVAFIAVPVVSAQTQPNLENGWKPYGSYDGSHLDSVNLMNGNLMFHAPILPDQDGRNGLTLRYTLYGSSKDWQARCFFNTSTQLWQCSWVKGGSGLGIQLTPTLMVHRTLNFQFFSGEAPTAEAAYGYTLETADGAVHQLHGVAGTEDANGEPTQFDSIDLSGYHLAVSAPDSEGVLEHVTVTDRSGNQYQGDFTVTLTQSSCPRPSQTTLSAPGNHPPYAEDAPMGDTYCPETVYASLITDSNGNQLSIYAPPSLNPTVDTLGRGTPFKADTTATTDSSGCLGSHPFYESLQYDYQDPDNITRHIKFCYAEVPIQTAFNQPNPHSTGTIVAEAATGVSGLHFYPVTTVILGDGTTWAFDYDSYGELSYIGLPTGGSISYGWQTVPFESCDSLSDTRRSRAVQTRTFNDGQGHSFLWQYQWGAHTSSGFTNTVTDPAGNDTEHIFSEQGPAGSGCHFYETSTIQYQGAKGAGQPLQRVDTGYSSQSMSIDETINTTGLPGLGNVFATDVTTTVYSNGNPTKVKLVHRDPDSGLGPGLPIFGNTIRELDYDWGDYPSHGPLLRETDTTYKWQIDSRYLTAGLLDLPAYVSMIDPKAGSSIKSDCHGWDSTLKATLKACASETSYLYDEFGLQPNDGGIPAGTLVAAPHSVRGNLTTVSRWLNTTNSLVSSHTHWYDTGEPYQKVDPLNHTTTYTYSSAYAGAYPTETCSQQTGTVTHCVSGTYDFNNGFLLSFSDENNQTSNYGYDLMFRLKSAQAPPDPANGSLRANTGFNYLTSGVPWQVIRTRPVTGALTDSLTTSLDGLGRVYKSEHAMPSGPPSTVTTTYDDIHAKVSVTNPYFTTADVTYGSTTTQSDALGRPLTITEQDGSVKTVSYDQPAPTGTLGDCSVSVDEAGHQRRTCSDALGRLVEVDEPNPGSINVAAQATLGFGGSLGVRTGVNSRSATPGTGVITIVGTAPAPVTVCNPEITPTPTNPCPGAMHISDHGSVTLTVGGHADTVNYSANEGSGSVALDLQTAINNDAGALIRVTSVSGGSLTVQSVATGAGTNYSWSISSQSLDTTGTFGPGPGPFSGSPGALSGGTNADPGITVYDKGTLTLKVGSFSGQVCYGTSSDCSAPPPSCPTGNSTAVQVACIAASVLNSSASPVSATYSGTATLAIKDKTAGQGGNGLSITVTPASTQTLTTFSPPSFSSAGATLGSGMNAGDVSNQPFVTLYSYDALGNLLCVEQHGGVSGTGCGAAPTSDASSPWRVRRFTYDSLSRLLTAHNPESGTITYSYDADGNLLQKTSPAPNQTGTATQTISYCYDGLHRVTGKAYSAQSCPLTSPVVTYTYDSGVNGKGHLSGVTDQAGSASYSYDVLGRLTSETRVISGVSKSISYDYNLDGSLKALHYPSGAVVTYTPDSAGRLLSAVDSANNINYATSAAYQADGQMTGFISGNGSAFAGITNSFSYNKRLQPVNMSATAPSQTVFSIGYEFHAGNGIAGTGTDNGNVWNLYNFRDRTRDQSFNYDLLNRLTSAQNAGTNCAATTVNGKTEYWGNNYGYDPWGNLTAKSVTKCSAENLTLTALVNNQLTGYGYDAAGNMTSDPTDGVTNSYDAENRIASATKAGVTTSYVYDADGNRVKKSSGSTGTLYWYMTPGIVAESDLGGNSKSEYVFFNGERVARKDFSGGTASVFYYFSDHLKTASVITDSAGNIKAESDYYPWGGELQFVNNDSNHYKFTGKERDTESGLDYFGARYYSNGLGRFITPDWAAKAVDVPYAEFSDPQSLNLYSYVRNVPTTKIDNDGHSDAMVQYNHCQASSACRAADEKDLKDHPFLHVAGPILVMATEAAIVFVPAIAVDIVRAIGESKSDQSPSPSQQTGPSSGRLPQDVHVNPVPPAANNGNGTVGPSPTQNSALQKDVAAAKAAGHTDIRVNQHQVNAQGQRVGVNRPDLQSTDANGMRHYTEYDRSAQNAADHHARTTANDPSGVTHTKIGP